MDEKNLLTQEFTEKTLIFLSTEDARKVSELFQEVLRDYTVSKEQYEVSTVLDDNDKYLRLFVASRRLEGLSDQTLFHYVYESRKMFKFLGKNFRDVTSLDVNYYLSEYERVRNVSRRTLDNMRRHISGYYLWLEKNEYIDKNPLKNVARISFDKKEIEILSDMEITQIRETLSEETNKYTIRLRAIFELLLATGMRVSEIGGLIRNDIDLDKCEVRVMCAKKRDRQVRRLFLTTEARYYLNRYLDYRDSRGWNNCDSLFQANKRTGKALTERDYNSQLMRLAKKAGITDKKVTVHTFRKTLASRLFRRGLSPKSIAYILGHSSIQTAEVYYIRLNIEDIKKNYERLY